MHFKTSSASQDTKFLIYATSLFIIDELIKFTLSEAFIQNTVSSNLTF